MIGYLLTLTMIKFHWLRGITNLRHKMFPLSASLDKTRFAFHFYDAFSVKNNLPIMHKHGLARQASQFLCGFWSGLIKTGTWYSLFIENIPQSHTRPWFTVLQIRFLKDNFSYFTTKLYIDSSLELSHWDCSNERPQPVVKYEKICYFTAKHILWLLIKH